MTKTIFAFILMAVTTSMAVAKPQIVIVPLQAGKSIPSTVAQKYDSFLRSELAKTCTVAETASTIKAMTSTGTIPKCSTDVCGANVSKASEKRFVLFSQITSADEIYQVRMILYDGALEKRVADVKEACELCAASEVNGTISAGTKKLAAALAAPAPVKKKVEKPKTPGVVSVQVKSVPTQAKVLLGTQPKGNTPVSFNVKPGAHTIVVTKEGFLKQERKISALDRAVALQFTLKKDPNYVAPVAKAVAPKPKKTDPKEPVAVESVGSSYNGLAWSFGVGGLALMGVGTWLVVLDGEITCTDGRGRRECPNVYNTKAFGLTAYGIGAVLLGAGSALIIDEFIRSRRQLKRSKATDKKVSIMASPLQGGASMGIFGRF